MTAPAIPIRNLYYLFCYAWDRFEEARSIATGAEDSPDLPNLLARVLINGTQSLLRRGFDRDYLPIEEDLSTVRGHIELGPTLQLQARSARRIQCTYDELSYDLLHNQLLKATLKRLRRAATLDPGLARELHALSTRMPDVSDIRLTPAAFARVQLHRNNARYDLLLKICALALENTIPLENGTGYAFQDVLRDERKMADVFERFVRNFYRAHLTAFRIKPLQLEWQATRLEATGVARLPTMRTDIYFESKERRIIIDTKYYADALQVRYEAVSYRSGNLYQLFAYLRNDALTSPQAATAEGMLLYPQVNAQLSDSYMIHGHRVQLATVDLAQPWLQVEQRLLDLVETGRGSATSQTIN